jgi:predicted lipoprotein with Yx(FWY)xxD motif
MGKSARFWPVLVAICAVFGAAFTVGAGATRADQAMTLQAGTNATLGNIVQSNGFSLYYLSDEAGGTFTCLGACLTAWPPLTVPAGSAAPSAGTGVLGTVGTVTRPDGSVQVTYNGFPAYFFAGDAAATDAKGNGIVSFGGTWHVAPNAATPPSSTSLPTSPLLQVASTSLGDTVVSSFGQTLYYNTAEAGTHFVCVKACEQFWPPIVLLPGMTLPTAASGINGLGTVTRPDGSQQVTYYSEPLYSFVKDTGSGQTNGNGIKAFGGTWMAVSPHSVPLAATPAVLLTLHISATGSHAWGRVRISYRLAGRELHATCNAAACSVVLAAGTSVRLSESAANAASRPFKEWTVKSLSAGHARAVPSPTLTLKPRLSVTVTARYRSA